MGLSRQQQAYLCAAVTVFFWSTVASAFKITLRHLDFLQMLFYASVVSLATLFLVLLIQGKTRLLARNTRTDYLRSAVLGLLNPFLYYTVVFKSYSLLPAQLAQPLNFIWPIMIVLLSIPLLRQRIGLKDVVAVFICFAGVLIVSTRGEVRSLRVADPLGVSLAVGSSVVWALFWIYNVRDPRDPVAKLFLAFAFSLIPTSICVFLFSGFRPHAAVGLVGAAYIGLFEMGLTFVIWLRALTLSRTTAQVSIFIYLVPFLSLVVIRQVLGETILKSTVIGLVLIVTGILVQQYARERPRETSVP